MIRRFAAFALVHVCVQPRGSPSQHMLASRNPNSGTVSFCPCWSHCSHQNTPLGGRGRSKRRSPSAQAHLHTAIPNHGLTAWEMHTWKESESHFGTVNQLSASERASSGSRGPSRGSGSSSAGIRETFVGGSLTYCGGAFPRLSWWTDDGRQDDDAMGAEYMTGAVSRETCTTRALSNFFCS